MQCHASRVWRGECSVMLHVCGEVSAVRASRVWGGECSVVLHVWGGECSVVLHVCGEVSAVSCFTCVGR